MTTALLIHDIQEEAGKFSLLALLRGFYRYIPSFNFDFKNNLKSLLTILENDTDDLSYFEELNADELQQIYTVAKKYNRKFDRLNDLYDSESYFDDTELKGLFRDVTRRLHKLENYSLKYLNRLKKPGIPIAEAMKEGGAALSQKAFIHKLSSES